MTLPITSDAIAALCRGTAASAITVEIVEQTGSTNADLLARIGGAAALRGPLVLIALNQTAGRGRAGRIWRSDGFGLTFSLAWPMPRLLGDLSGLPLAVGVGIADALATHGIKVALKWPNDVLHEGHKLAGVLVEAVEQASLLHQNVWVVVGIGINMSGPTPPLESPSAARGPCHGSAALPATDRNLLMATLLVRLTETLQTFGQQGFAAFMTRWNALHAYEGRGVDILDGAQVKYSGCAQGVDASGRLLLKTGNGQVAIVAGDVSLRAMPMLQVAGSDLAAAG